MKKLLLFILFLPATILAQDIQILSKQDNETVPYANITYLAKDSIIGGTYADEDGKVRLEIPAQATHVEVSSIGYHTQKIEKEGIPLQIYLEENTSELSEIVLNNSKYRKNKTKKLGFPVKYKHHSFIASKGFETVTFFENTLAIEKTILFFSFYLKEPEYNNYSSFLFRIVFYKNVNGCPSEKVYVKKGKNDVITIKPNQYGKIRIDVSNLNISLPKEGMFIGLEYIGLIDNETSDIKKTGEFDEETENQAGISFLKSKNKNASYTFIKFNFIEKSKNWLNLATHKNEAFPFLKADEYYVPAFGIEVYE